MAETRRVEPKASRPNMPGYGIVDEHSGKGLLPWNWAVERLSRGHNYWVATTRPDGRPHSMPVWGVWVNDRFCFSTGERSRKARNLAGNPYCVVSPESAAEAVVMEGIAEQVTDPDLLRRAGDAYYAKYQWKLDPALGPIFVVRPRLVYGFIEYQMTVTATRWVFDDATSTSRGVA